MIPQYGYDFNDFYPTLYSLVASYTQGSTVTPVDVTLCTRRCGLPHTARLGSVCVHDRGVDVLSCCSGIPLQVNASSVLWPNTCSILRVSNVIDITQLCA